MNTASRKINEQTKVNPYTSYVNVWTFRTQELMDLYINEMSGQISDGNWENSRNTEWLWTGNAIYRLGDKTELIHHGYEYRKKTSYPLTKDLIDAIEERIYTENGFEYGDKKSLKAAWDELVNAIKNHRTMKQDEYEKYISVPEKNKRNKIAQKQNEMANTLNNVSKFNVAENGNIKSWFDVTIGDKKVTVFKKSVDYIKGGLLLSASYRSNSVTLNVPVDEKFDEKVIAMVTMITNV